MGSVAALPRRPRGRHGNRKPRLRTRGLPRPQHRRWGSPPAPVVKWIIIVNIVVFLLQIIVVREERYSRLDLMRQQNPTLDKLIRESESDPAARAELKKTYPYVVTLLESDDPDVLLTPPVKVSLVQEWCDLATDKVINHGQIWRLLTCTFCHDRLDVLHILFNMLFLYWFGCEMETLYGSREFLWFYLTAAVISSMTFVGLDLYTGSRIPALGISGAVMAVTMLFTMHYPRHTILLLFIIPIEMRLADGTVSDLGFASGLAGAGGRSQPNWRCQRRPPRRPRVRVPLREISMANRTALHADAQAQLETEASRAEAAHRESPRRARARDRSRTAWTKSCGKSTNPAAASSPAKSESTSEGKANDSKIGAHRQ